MAWTSPAAAAVTVPAAATTAAKMRWREGSGRPALAAHRRRAAIPAMHTQSASDAWRDSRSRNAMKYAATAAATASPPPLPPHVPQGRVRPTGLAGQRMAQPAPPVPQPRTRSPLPPPPPPPPCRSSMILGGAAADTSREPLSRRPLPACTLNCHPRWVGHHQRVAARRPPLLLLLRRW